MKVLFIARHDLFSYAGGDTTQIVSTAKYLEKLGVQVTIKLSTEKIDYSPYHLIHYFNIIDPEDILGHIFKSKKPYVVSTIYVDYSEYDRVARKDLLGFVSKFIAKNRIEYLKTTAKFLLKGEKVSTLLFFLYGHKNSIRYILKNASALLPNSHNEYKRIVNDFGIDKPYFVITNAIDAELFKSSKEYIRNEQLVLCAARIEGNKNQLNLIKAINQTPYQLWLVGKTSTNQKRYVSSCKKLANQQTTFLAPVTQNELVALYAQAKVHVLPSWFETTGLSSLEAAAMGCNIVVADKGDVREYFGDLAYYCSPDNPQSILNAIQQAMQSATNEVLRQKVLTDYTWEKTAQQTYQAYKAILKND
ncbi:MAG: glycosyltransferase family 4 protein [Bacteroidia bacterium]|jgi:glycosyltransferase involved in cell wall biosynthesis|nr:glycosyltransferase family 4 protein [Bacteroidia bacterium]